MMKLTQKWSCEIYKTNQSSKIEYVKQMKNSWIFYTFVNIVILQMYIYSLSSHLYYVLYIVL